MTTDGEPAPKVSGDSGLQSFTLESLTSAVNYHRWVTDLIAPYLGDDPLEIGSGLGDYARTWLDDGLAKVTVSDLDPHRLQLLRERFLEEPRPAWSRSTSSARRPPGTRRSSRSTCSSTSRTIQVP